MDRQPRRFGMGDLMILIAALGAGMWGVQDLWKGLTLGPLASWWSATPRRLIVAAALSASVAPLTLAALAFRLRRPRPAWRRVAIQPGAAAALACALVFALRTMQVAAAFTAPTEDNVTRTLAVPIPLTDSTQLLFVRHPVGNGLVSYAKVHKCYDVAVTTFAAPCGYAVAAVWLVLGLSGRWRPERSWIDRLGRVVGVAWIAIMLLAMLPLR